MSVEQIKSDMKKYILLWVLLIPALAWAQDRTVTGRVTSSEDELPLPGVNVTVEGTTKGTVTDVDGNYTLTLTPEENNLVFSFVGYKSQTVAAGDQTALDVVLEADVTSLNEVVVIGYGVARKSDVTGAVASVDAEAVARIPSSTAAEALQGRVAGLQVTTNGAPGGSPTVRIRGLGSVSSRVDPLYVVDGVLVDDISFLGTTDIESVNILKDASASAIYGIRAANGVVIITTRRGNKDQPRVTYSGYGGFQVPINRVEMATGQQYIQLLNEKDQIAADRTGGTFTARNPANFPSSTDWYDEILREQAYIQSHDLGFSGGSENTTFAIGASYFDQEGLARKNDFKRLNIRSSVEAKVTKFLKAGVNATLSTTRSNNAPGSLFSGAYIAPPAIPVMAGDTTFASPQAFGDFPNPAATLFYNNDETRGVRLVGSVFGEVYLAKSLTFRSAYGVDGSYSQNRRYIPYYNVSSAQRDTTRSLIRRFDNGFNYYWDNTLTYDQTLNDKHHVTVLLGMNAQEQRFYAMEARRQGVQNLGENTWYLNLGSVEGQTNTDEGFRIASLSFFGRVNYAFDDRYLFTATLRRDGTSIFPENNRYEYFPSVGLGWVISAEPFMQDQNLFQFLKLRASWGKMGNNRIPANTAVRVISTGGTYTPVFGGTPQTGASITIVGPQNLLWETTQEIDVALEAYFLENRLSIETDFYHRRTEGAIFPVTVNGAIGASNAQYLDNNADIVNRGIEVSLNWRDQIRDFGYNFGVVFARNHNEVVDLREGTVGIFGGYINVTPTTYTTLGHSVGEFYGRRVVGIFQSDEDVANYVGESGEPIQPGAQPGDFKFADVNEDGVINDRDRVFLGSAIPKYNIGINLGASYKGFDIALDLYGQGGNKIYNGRRYRQLGNENYDREFFENRWTGEGSTNNFPSADLSADANKQANSFYLESGNFFKIRNIQIGYTLPNTLTGKIGVKSVRVFANATNPIVWFKYSGFTPEIPTAPSSVNNANTTNITSQGVDINVYPMAATYNFGLNINL